LVSEFFTVAYRRICSILRQGFQDGKEDPSHHLAKTKIHFLLLSYSNCIFNGSAEST
jgi:hypothetical protein